MSSQLSEASCRGGKYNSENKWLNGIGVQNKAIQQTGYSHCFSFVFAPSTIWRQLIVNSSILA